MTNIIKQRLKHGIFSYYSNDQYIGKSLSEYGEWSEPEIHLLTQLLSDSENVIEVGSNIGTHTIPLAKHVSKGGLVYAIEPQYQNHKLLLENIKNNEIKNVEILKVAVSSKEGRAYMNTFDENMISNYGDSKIFNSDFKNAECVQVKTLDQLFYDDIRYKRSIKLIKCDAQGQELNIILGSRKIIDMYKPHLYLENDDINISKSLIEEIKNMGYKMFWHLPPLYNPNNFLKNTKNIFPKTISCNMFCFHHSSKIKLNNLWKKLEITDSNHHPLKK
tara:strand:+ start:51 stop:875 length:825 start_codon:yes stop_codon:yes gene_type:complete